jgi:hypothetical protein
MSLCLPIASAALAVAGAGANYAGQEKAKSAMNRTTMAELLRQRGINDKASAEFASSLSKSGRNVAETQLQEGESQKESGYRDLQAVPLDTGPAPLVGGTSSAVNLQDKSQLNLSNRNRAKLGSYDKWQLDQMVKNVRSSQQQANFGQQASRSQAVLPLELQDASHKGDSLTDLGSILGLLSSLASVGSLSGGSGLTSASKELVNASAGANTLTGAANWAQQVPNWITTAMPASTSSALSNASALSMISGFSNLGNPRNSRPTYRLE